MFLPHLFDQSKLKLLENRLPVLLDQKNDQLLRKVKSELSDWVLQFNRNRSPSELSHDLINAAKRHPLAFRYLLEGAIEADIDQSHQIAFKDLYDKLQNPVRELEKIYALLCESYDQDSGQLVTLEEHIPLIFKRVLPGFSPTEENYWMAVGICLDHGARDYNVLGKGIVKMYPLQYLLECLGRFVKIKLEEFREYEQHVSRVIEYFYGASQVVQQPEREVGGREKIVFQSIMIYVISLGSNTPNEADCLYTLYCTAPSGERLEEGMTGTYNALKAGFARFISSALLPWFGQDGFLVEFVLSENCLNWDVDQWEISIKPIEASEYDDNQFRFPLGNIFPVVLRNSHRYEKQDRIEKLKFKYKKALSKLRVYWCQNPREESALMTRFLLPVNETVLYLGIGYPLSTEKREQLWNAVIQHGLPVVLWHRARDAQSPSNMDLLKTLLASDDKPLAFEQIPNNLRNWRIEASDLPHADFAKGVSLLWEDPTRIPSLIKQQGDPLGGIHSPLAAQTALDSNSSTNMQAWIDLIS